MLEPIGTSTGSAEISRHRSRNRSIARIDAPSAAGAETASDAMRLIEEEVQH